ncbi:MAG: flagellar basal body rod protein FlgB [Candidatus Sericytochromatia bacterium]|nr:flagellar basal body rod protein FlgB [Candidatus Tanganyikabacteria bacterium]
MLFDKNLRGVERAMDGLALRFQAASQNLANIHTPGYQRQIVDFEASLKEAIAAGETPIDPDNPMTGSPPSDSYMLEIWHPQRKTVERKQQRIDGNGVSLEAEMADVTRTALNFNMAATWVAAEYRNLKYVVDAR